MMRILLLVALLAQALPAGPVAGVPVDFRDAARDLVQDPACPAERVEAVRDLILRNGPPDVEPASPTFDASRLDLYITAALRAVAGSAATPTCERLPYDATGPPSRG